MPDSLPPGQKIDLANCDREPIHVLGNIQAFGFLIAVTSDWLICRVSTNSREFIGRTPEEILGKPLVDIFCEDAVHAIRNRVALLRGMDAVVEATNLLAQGYEPLISPDGQTLFLAQVPRGVLAGLAFSF